MTVRKNFVFDEEVARHLEELAKARHKSQTALVQEMVEENYKEIEKKKKREAFDGFVGSMSGAFDAYQDELKVVQKIKADMDV